MKLKRSQAFIEYAVLISAVSVALLAMFSYVRGSINARFKNVQMDLNEKYQGS